METIISRAARLIRAGDQFSGTNQKLKEAVWEFIECLLQQTESDSLTESMGWWFTLEDGGIHTLNFTLRGERHFVTARWQEQGMTSIHAFCEALAGAGGEQLQAWLEGRTIQRMRFLEAFQSCQEGMGD